MLIELTNGVIMSLENLGTTLPPCHDNPHFMVADEAAKQLRDKLIHEVEDMQKQERNNEVPGETDILTRGERIHE